jgi:hypothetical protein
MKDMRGVKGILITKLKIDKVSDTDPNKWCKVTSFCYGLPTLRLFL